MLSSVLAQYRQIPPHEKTRLYQGDILTDFTHVQVINELVLEFKFPYVVILSQDCDLESVYRHIDKIKQIDYGDENQAINVCNQFLPNVLILPVFSLATLLDGSYLQDLYKISADFTSSIDDLKLNTKLERYHYLFQEDLPLPELAADFKCFFSSPLVTVLAHKANYVCTINELFRERLSQRFASYISRIGLPEFNSIQYCELKDLNELQNCEEGVYKLNLGKNIDEYYQVIKGKNPVKLILKTDNNEIQENTKFKKHLNDTLKEFNKNLTKSQCPILIAIKDLRMLFSNFQ